MHEINEQQLVELLRARTILQRKIRSELEKLQTIENDLEQLLAEAEGREPVQRFVSIEVRGSPDLLSGRS